MKRLHSRHMTRANANTVMLDIPPKSRRRGRLCSKFNLDMTSGLLCGRVDNTQLSETNGLTKLVAFDPKQTGGEGEQVRRSFLGAVARSGHHVNQESPLNQETPNGTYYKCDSQYRYAGYASHVAALRHALLKIQFGHDITMSFGASDHIRSFSPTV
jgi:hypothetical protein